MSMKFDEAERAAKEYGAKIGPITKHQGWVHLAGPFTPAMLRAIADEVEKIRGDTRRPISRLVQ